MQLKILLNKISQLKTGPFQIGRGLLFLFFMNISSAQDNNFILSTENFQSYFPTFIGNGNFSLSSTQTGLLPAHSYMIKVFDHAEDDIPRIASLPAWNEILYFNGIKELKEPLTDTSEFKNYVQKLDMYNGTLETGYIWTIDDRETNINVLSFVSRKNKNLAVTKVEITPDFSDTISLSFPIKERDKPERMALAKLEKIKPNPPGKWPAEWYPGFMEILNSSVKIDDHGGQLNALSQTEGRHTKVALAAEIFYEGEIADPQISYTKENKSAGITIKFIAEKDKKYTFYKIISALSEKEDKKNIVDEAVNICREARKKGFNQLFTEHKEEWHRLWQTDIVIEGDDKLQQIVRSMIFYLLCSIDENTNFSIAPMGLATSGYYGHIFWDADTYMFPPLLFMHPGMAKSIVMFRYDVLESAKENAKKNDYSGAMYPWESDELGNETTPFFAYQNALKENHIVGDVALAQWQYFLATKDTNWLREYGSKVIEATAEFWPSRADYNKEKDRYEIGKVVSVSEGLIDVSNETYTNSIAKINLEIALKVNKILNKPVNAKWEETCSKMYIPYNEKEEFHPTFGTAQAGEGATELWSSVVNLLTYPLQMEMSDNAKRNNLNHAVKSLGESGAGAMMGTNFVPIIAAELGMDSLFNAIISNTLYGYLRPPFNALAETHTNNSVNFITGAGSFLQQVIFGYTGLRLTEAGLVQKYDPMLPKKVKSLSLKNFTVNNEKFDIVVKNNKLNLIKIK